MTKSKPKISTQRYVALLRGVSPSNAKMPELKACFERAGFGNVKTVLSSGNVIFDAESESEAALLSTLCAAMSTDLPRNFEVILRSSAALKQLIEENPFKPFSIAPEAKRVVSFLSHAPSQKISLPIELEGAQILAVRGLDVLAAYVAHPKGPVFMTLIEKTFGKAVTTRTWDTVKKCAAA
jgi:uncharacterized protein (DUF1697 family)